LRLTIAHQFIPIMITKIISDDQTGADRSGLGAALHCDRPYGSCSPRGRKAEGRSVTTRHIKAVVKIIRWPAGDEELNDYDAYVAYPQLACILNEAGSRETRAQGMQKAAFRLMVDALIKVNPACKKFYRL